MQNSTSHIVPSYLEPFARVTLEEAYPDEYAEFLETAHNDLTNTIEAECPLAFFDGKSIDDIPALPF